MLKARLNKDLTDALKAKNEAKLATLRLLSSAIHNREIDKRTKTGGDEPLTDEEVLGVLKNEAKKRKEAAELYDKGGRADLSAREKEELKIIEEYLPAEMSDEELGKIVDEVFAEMSPSGPADFGKVMGAAMKKTTGQASGDRVKEAIQKKFS